MFPSSGRRTLMCSPRWEVVPQGLRESLRKLWTEQQGVGFQGCLEAGGRGGRGSREADRHGGLRKPGASPGRQRMRRKGNPTRVPEAAWHLAGPPGLLRIRSAQAFPSLTRQQKSDHGPDSGVCACKLKQPARHGGPTPPPSKPPPASHSSLTPHKEGPWAGAALASRWSSNCNILQAPRGGRLPWQQQTQNQSQSRGSGASPRVLHEPVLLLGPPRPGPWAAERKSTSLLCLAHQN